MKIKIIYTLTHKETENEYKNIHPDLILDDFVNNFQAWLDCGILEVRKVKK